MPEEPFEGLGAPPGVVRLQFNENPLGPAVEVLEAMKQQNPHVNRYGENEITAIYRKIAEFHDVPHPEDFNPVVPNDKLWISVGSGSVQLLHAATLAYLTNGGEVIEPCPCFGAVSSFAESVGATVVRPTLKDYTLDLPAILSSITENTRLIVLSNPNNPTGTIVTHEALSAFMDDVPRHIKVIVDEAYIDLVESDTCADGPRLVKAYENVLAVRTFSKGYALAGLRIGYAIGHPEVIQRIRIFQGGLVGAFTCYAAHIALEHQDHLERTRAVARASKHLYYDTFNQLGLDYVPSEATFVLVDVGRNSNEVVPALAERGIQVSNGASWGLPHMIRVSIGTPRESEAFVVALREVLG